MLALLWYGALHLLSAAMPSYTALLPLRCLCMLGAAAFTPQAAAAISALAAPQDRGRAIAFVFLGWSLASVLGMPLSAYVGETFGWRWAFAGVALIALAAAAAIARAVPAGIKTPPLSLGDWRRVFTSPLLMLVVAVTALSSAGQFTLFSYFAPYYSQVLGASAAQIGMLFLWFGAVGLLGNLLVARYIDRIGAATAVTLTLACMAAGAAVVAAGDRVRVGAAGHHAVGAGLFCFEFGAAGAAGTGRAAAGDGADLVELLGHVPGPVRRCRQRRRHHHRHRLQRAELGGGRLDAAVAAGQRVGGQAHEAAQRWLSHCPQPRCCAGRPRPARSSASSTGWPCRVSAVCWRWRSANWSSASAG